MPTKRSYGSVSPLASFAVRVAGSMPVTRCSGSSLTLRAASASRNICATSPVTGTGRAIGNVVAISTESRMPCCVKCSCSRKEPSNGAGGHLKGCPRTETSTLPPLKSASAARGRVDGCHRLLAELDAVLLEVAVVEPDVVGRLTAEHHLELGETEVERVVAIDQRDANRVHDRLREPGRELQSAEPGSEDQDVLGHRRQSTA